MRYLDENLSFEKRAAYLVSEMTVEECASQMLFQSPEIKRLGIKAYNWWNEALHGVARCGMATVFPQAIGMAATFDDELIYNVADTISTEGRAKYNMYQEYEDYGIYKGITFWSPNVNIFRDPRWGRGQETYGEDPYLTSKLGVAFVNGLQGDDKKHMKTAACAKHFAVHSGPEKLRHEFNAVANKKDMAETYLPAFKALVDCGVEGFMGAYNRTNGEPCCGSKTLMIDLLRNEWGFDGYYTSDCWAVADFHLHHKIVDTCEEAIALAVNNGCDLNCGNAYEHLMKVYETGLISEEKIKQSATRLMLTRMKLGMFDKQTNFDNLGFEHVDSDKNRLLNEETARKSLVLLKNNGILPLNKDTSKKILVVGSNANSIVALEGNYHGTANQYHTVLESVRSKFTESKVLYSKGSHLHEHKLEDPGYDGDRLAEVKAMTDYADVVILVVGLDETIEGEELMQEGFEGDKKSLYLPKCQMDLIKTICERNTPVVLVNLSGSSIDFGYGNENTDAIVQAWYPGAMGGKAIADLIAGEYSPSGRLPVTFYKEENELPDFLDYSMENRTYKYFTGVPLYPFGYGLSYTSFEYSYLEFKAKEIHQDEDIHCSIKVKNTGIMDSDEVVQVYITDDNASVDVPIRKLVFFKRINLLVGQEKIIDISIDSTHLQIILENGDKAYEQGSFTLYVGGSQPDDLSMQLTNSNILKDTINLI